MLHFDPATTSGSAVASLFRVWCSLRDGGPGRRPEAAKLAGAVEEMFAGLGLDPAGPPAQVEPPGTGEVFTVVGLRYDRADALLVAGVIPGRVRRCGCRTGRRRARLLPVDRHLPR